MLKKNGLHINNRIIERISGPVSMFALKPNTKSLPEFLLFGDAHRSYSNMCDKITIPIKKNYYSISDESFLSMFDTEGVNFFVEDNFYFSQNSGYVVPRGPLHEITNIARNCYNDKRYHGPCRFKFIKWHYNDIRSIIKKKDVFLGTIQLLGSLTSQSNRYYLMKLSSVVKLGMANVTRDILTSIISYFNPSDSFIQCFVSNSPLIQKQETKSEIKLLHELNIFFTNIENVMYVKYGSYFPNFKAIKDYLIEFKQELDVFNLQDPEKISDETINKFNIFHYLMFELRSLTVDIYSIQRAFKYQDSKLNIMYMGHAHIVNIRNFLVDHLKLYSTEYEQNNAQDNNIDTHSYNRCITIDKPVETFFSFARIDKPVETFFSFSSSNEKLIKDISSNFLMNVDELKRSVNITCKRLNISKRKCLKMMKKSTTFNKRIKKNANGYEVFNEHGVFEKSFTTLSDARDHLFS